MRAASGDLTAAAAIRETAMRLFAQRGAAAVTIREIAAEAGVSPSLVIHHYGSKAGLREAVDKRAIALVDALVTELTTSSRGGPSASLAAALSSELERDPLLPAYMRRLLIDGGKPAETLFRSLFEAVLSGFATLEAAGLVRPSSDAEVRAAFLLVNDLAVVLLRDQVHEVLGIDPLARSGMERWTAQVLDVYSRGVLRIGEVSSTETDPPRRAAS
jgi:AcrR family transcriptional regulator